MRSARCASDCACMPSQKNRSVSSQTAPRPLLSAAADGYHLTILCALAAIPARYIEYTGIGLSGIGLPRYCHTCGKAHFLRDHRINLIDRLLIAVKQFQKACLCTSRSLGAQAASCRRARTPDLPDPSANSCAQSVARFPTVVGCAG